MAADPHDTVVVSKYTSLSVVTVQVTAVVVAIIL